MRSFADRPIGFVSVAIVLSLDLETPVIVVSAAAFLT
jgi:hypothetical protein